MSARDWQRERDGGEGEWTAPVTPAGSTQATATGLFPTGLTQGPSLRKILLSQASASTGVILPVSVPGMEFWIKNNGTNAVYVYPPTGGTINAIAANSGLSLPAASICRLVCTAGDVGRAIATAFHGGINTSTVGAALTTQLAALTTANSNASADYALQAVINTNAWGFAAEVEAISFIYVVQNLQVRVAELEARLQAAGIVA